MNDAIKTKVTAPKLTESQRKALSLIEEMIRTRAIGVRGTIATSTRRSLIARGLLKPHGAELTDAGRAALWGSK